MNLVDKIELEIPSLDNFQFMQNKRVRNALDYLGIKTTEQLLECSCRDLLLRIGFGVKSMYLLESELKECGLSIKESCPHSLYEKYKLLK